MNETFEFLSQRPGRVSLTMTDTLGIPEGNFRASQSHGGNVAYQEHVSMRWEYLWRHALKVLIRLYLQDLSIQWVALVHRSQ